MHFYKYALKTLVCAFVMTGFLMVSGNAQAKPKLWIFGWGNHHWKNQDYKSYLMPPAQPHNRQWDTRLEDRGNYTFEKWSPEQWLGTDNGAQVIDGFFEADILRDQKIINDIPVLIVGSNFYRLSGFDKRRVTDVINQAYQITNSEAGYFELRDEEVKEIIGYYDRYGLRLN